ncbi:xanthine dehydrogenase family protein subunit M [Mycobacterium sp. PS03-16]|uniref:FAD binding domain-containing protein n=1 Tax=Mycobacterium sp. PS03-16 TaxID=2559611 RepID=UPI001073E669|nr:xanthine dehydrogenase family protein subunit M [Mycobacterium sp. PS03-16]TFV57350.1 xanthine dehydrogenase family protein subunit M [Mycobacterium sp. PS03-16]
MRPFRFHRAASVDDAVQMCAVTGGHYYAGGTNLLDLMKNGVETPADLIDVRRLALGEIRENSDGAVVLGATATNSAVANHPLVRTRYPMLSQAILSGATTQLRNMATVGGNLMQRTRCPYFMDPAFTACDKRSPGSGCGARAGLHREHAIFGADGSCVAVQPSDMAVALRALDASVHVHGPDGSRVIAVADFFRLPGDEPGRDNTLRPGELITAVVLPPSPFGAHSWYLKVRDRHSYAFALVSVAAGLEVVDGVVRSASLAMGGVAARPWRVPAAEALMVGQTPSVATFKAAAQAFMTDAEPLPQNAFKVDLGYHSVVRALRTAAVGGGVVSA